MRNAVTPRAFGEIAPEARGQRRERHAHARDLPEVGMGHEPDLERAAKPGQDPPEARPAARQRQLADPDLEARPQRRETGEVAIGAEAEGLARGGEALCGDRPRQAPTKLTKFRPAARRAEAANAARGLCREAKGRGCGPPGV
jgi:hypothetical protein